MSDCLENRYSQFDIESPHESSSASRAECHCGCFMTRARQLQVSINNRAHHDQGMRRNTKCFLFIQVNISEDTKKTHASNYKSAINIMCR